MARKKMPSIDTTYETPTLRVASSFADSDEIVFVFQSVDGVRAETGKEEYAAFATDFGARSAVFITDKLNTWANADGYMDAAADQIQAAQKQSGAARTIFLGSSMGGFNAMALSRAIRPDRVVALSPQWSIDPTIMPDDPRWARNALRIGTFSLPTIEDCITDQTEYIVVHGWNDPDINHVMRFQEIRNLALIGLPWARHTFAKTLHRKRILVEFLQTMCGGSLVEIDRYCQGRSMFLRKPLNGWEQP